MIAIGATYLRTDERVDVLASLSVCQQCLDRIEAEPGLWKWVILSMHNAMQGAMVCHLSGTAQLGALDKKSATAWLAWHQRDIYGEIERISDGIDEFGIPITRIKNKIDYPPKAKLANAKQLFKRLYNNCERVEPSAGGVLKISEAERRSFDQLNKLRNEFSHFTPKGWSIELSGLPETLEDVLGVMQKIALDPWPFRHLGSVETAKLDEILLTLRARLNGMSTGL